MVEQDAEGMLQPDVQDLAVDNSGMVSMPLGRSQCIAAFPAPTARAQAEETNTSSRTSATLLESRACDVGMALGQARMLMHHQGAGGDEFGKLDLSFDASANVGDEALGAHASMEQGQQAYVQGGRVAGMEKEACWVPDGTPLASPDGTPLASLLPTPLLPIEARGTESGGRTFVSLEGEEKEEEEEEEECLSRAKRLLAFLKGGAVGV